MPADVIVVGLGAMGAAVCHELARRGVAVLGVDAHAPPHGLGSSHGRTRITREAYFEHPLYVPLVQRANELWAELEELTGAVLYRQTGGLMVGPPAGVLVQGALESARAHGLEHEQLSAAEICRRFPGLLAEPEHVGVFEPRAGILLPEACVRTLLTLARGYGADLRMNTRVESWRTDAGGDVVLRTSSGELRAREIVLAAGPWLNALLAAGLVATGGSASPLQLPLAVERQVSYWFAPPPGVHAYRPAQCPIAIWEYADGRFIYTFPDIGHGVKVGVHHEGRIVDPDAGDRTVSAGEEARARRLLEWCMPDAAQRALDASVCLYTNTPDGHFLLDRHPHHEQLFLLSACSGHGFKFAPAIGEAVADVLLEDGSSFDLRPFEVDRLL
jgi:sarcosine oxidase